jgi:hypothetical protein
MARGRTLPWVYLAILFLYIGYDKLKGRMDYAGKFDSVYLGLSTWQTWVIWTGFPSGSGPAIRDVFAFDACAEGHPASVEGREIAGYAGA